MYGYENLTIPSLFYLLGLLGVEGTEVGGTIGSGGAAAGGSGGLDGAVCDVSSSCMVSVDGAIEDRRDPICKAE